MTTTLHTYPLEWITKAQLPENFLNPEATFSTCQVLIGTEDDAELHEEMIEDSDKSTEQWLKASEAIDGRVWLEALPGGKELLEDISIEIEEVPLEVYGMTEEELKVAKNVVTLDVFEPLEEDEDTTDKQVGLCTLPISESWQAPAYLHFGHYNECPEPSVHAALMRYWQQKYNIRVVTITGCTIECTVQNPPQTDEEALELAKEQTLYCPDITEGFGGIGALAYHLKQNKQWFFWWD